MSVHLLRLSPVTEVSNFESATPPLVGGVVGSFYSNRNAI
jgi:hypothetical protein